ncbi:MAG: hypothetical protein Q8P91_03045 [bacterium]|nr:hypothetical protein [bacterium]
MPERGINKLLAAMVVNRKFAARFLDPDSREATIKEGYLGEEFDLTTDELTKLLQINADSPRELARQLIEPNS